MSSQSAEIVNKKVIKNGISYEINGWLYVSIKGNAKERGYAYGYLIANEMKAVFKMLNFLVFEETGQKWEFFIDLGVKYLKQTIIDNYPEFYEEMEGVAEGCTAGGTQTSIDEILAWNNYFSLTGYLYPNINIDDNKTGHRPGGEGGAVDRCSAFIANGAYTHDGKIVMAHNDFANFVDGQYGRVVIDINPSKGHRILMQGITGWIWSGSDFFITGKGIMGTETTIGGFIPFENNFPISCRLRQAMQYGNDLDDYVNILVTGNSGDYACSWLFGDTNTNEIMRLELGLKYHKVDKTKSGYFIGFNAPYDPRIRNLECVNSGFDDIRRHQGARRVRLAELMDEHKGKINVEIAKLIIADHYDVYLNKINPCSRTVCSHYELDAREYMSQADRPKPYQPRGALNGKVCDTELTKKMAFVGIYGNSCGTPFYKDTFCDMHREWDYLREYLNDRLRQPWTYLTITNDYNKNNKLYLKNVTNLTKTLFKSKKNKKNKKNITRKIN
jgi:hypothetical protein